MFMAAHASPAYGVHVRKRIGRGRLSEQPGIVAQRTQNVHRLHQSHPCGRRAHDDRIFIMLKTVQHPSLRIGYTRQGGQYLLQKLRSRLRRSSRRTGSIHQSNVIATPPSRETILVGHGTFFHALPPPADSRAFAQEPVAKSFHLCQSTSLFCPFRDVDATFTETPTRKMVFHTGKLYAVPSPVQSTAGNGFRQMLHPDVSGIR